MSKHTPGPWIVYDGIRHVAILKDEGPDRDGTGIAVTAGGGRDHVPDAEEWANARLIAAAPDMVDLLREGLGGWSGPHGLMAWRDKIRAALAKAEGGAR